MLRQQKKQITELKRTLNKSRKSVRACEAENQRLILEREHLQEQITRCRRDHVPKLTVDQTINQVVLTKARYMHNKVWYKWLMIFTMLLCLIFCDLLTCCEHTRADYTRQMLSWLDF